MVVAIIAAGCDVAAVSEAPSRQLPELPQAALVAEQRKLVNNAYESTRLLISATRSYLANPDAEHRSILQAHWIRAHEQYLRASVLQQPTSEHSNMDSWPVHPGFFDSLPAYPDSGIISDEKLAITPEILRAQHQITSDEEVALGFHVLEYYAFERPMTDFQVNARHQQRRLDYVSIVLDLLMADITIYQRSFGDNPQDSLPQSFPALIDRVHQQVQATFSESNLLGQHSPAAGTSAQDIAVQLQQIRSLLGEPVGLNRILLELNPTTTEVFHNTLNEVITLLPEAGPLDDAASSRLLLLTAALSHQLEDFQRLLSREGEI